MAFLRHVGWMKEKRRCITGWGVLLVAVGFLACGLSRGEAVVVLQKAVNLCLECIGLG